MESRYNTLAHEAESDDWGSFVERALSTGEYNGLSIVVSKGYTIKTLAEIAPSLSKIEYLKLQGAVLDDSMAFACQSLKELTLLTRCRKPIPDIRAAGLASLGIDDRPGKEKISALNHLSDLAVWSWRSGDLSFLHGLSSLVRLHVEGRRGVISLQGIDSCLNLEEIEIIDLRVADLKALKNLCKLGRIWFIGYYGPDYRVELDLVDLSALNALKELRITYGGAVRSLTPLLGIDSLMDVRFRGSQVIDGDLSPLAALSARGVVAYGPGD